MRWVGIAMASLVACSGSGATTSDQTIPVLPETAKPGCKPATAAATLRDDGFLGRALIEARRAQSQCPDHDVTPAIAALEAQLGMDQALVTPSDERVAEALTLYREGVGLRLANDTDGAIEALNKSFELAPHAFTLVQIGLTYEAANDAVQMRVAFARALVLAERSQDAVAQPAVRNEHMTAPGVMAFSPDARLCASADTYAVIVWDVATGRQIRTLPGGRLGIGALAFSPDGHTFAVGTSRGILRLVDTRSWEVREEHLHSDGIEAIAFSPDGARVLTGGADERIAVHDVATFDMIFGVRVGVRVRRVAYSSDGASVAVGGGDQIMVRTAEGDLVRSFAVAREHHREYAFSADLSLAVSAHRGWPIRLWNPTTGELLREISVDGLDVSQLALSSNGETLVVGDFSGVLREFSTATGEMVRTIGAHTQAVLSIELSPGGAIMASSSSDSSISLRDFASGEVVRNLGRQRGGVTAVRFSPDGRALVSGDLLGDVHVWDLTKTGGHRAYPVMKRVRKLDVDATGTRVVVGGDGVDVVVLEIDTGAETQRLHHDDGNTSAVRFGPRGERVAAASTRGAFGIWAIADGERLATWSVGGRGFVDIAPNLERYASTHQWLVSVYSAVTGEKERELGLVNSAYGMGYSADSAILISTTGQGDVQLWNLDTGEELRGFKVEHRERIEDAALSPDGTLVALASADESISLYDLKTDVLRAKLLHDDDVYAVAFSPDGRTLASASHDKSIRLWDPATGAQVATLTATSDEWLVVAEDGRIDGNRTDDGGPSFLYWEVGDLQLPGFVGWQRAHVDGLLADVLSHP